MYTGTSSDVDFSVFKMPRNGTWFTYWPEEASEYAKENDSQGMKYDGRAYSQVNASSRVIPVYLQILKPYTLKQADLLEVNVSNYKVAQGRLFDRLRAEGYDGVQWTPSQWVAIGSKDQIKSVFNDKPTESSNISKSPKMTGATDRPYTAAERKAYSRSSSIAREWT